LFISDAEVLQEILHRYISIRAWARGKTVFESFAELMAGRAESIQAGDVEQAARLFETHPNLDGRDLLHLAVMTRLGVTRVVTADKAFDGVVGIERLDPARVSDWRDSL
jgi:predicted nucleic acid-binding protein